MKTFSSPDPAVSLAPQLYFQLVHTLTDLLPPPLDHSPEALVTRNKAAIAKAAAMLPVNADETDLAAQCIAARGQAEDVMRLIRENRHDIALVMRLNAQYTSMVRTSLSVEALLMRVQAVRRKREAIKGAVDQDAWTQHVVQRCMLTVAEPDTARPAVSPLSAREEAPEAAQAEAPAPVPYGNQETEEIVSENKTNSHDVALETRMSEHPCDQAPESPEEAEVREHIRETQRQLLLAARALSANGRESSGRTD